MPSVLTIAGSDSSGRAGIQADLRTLLSLGVHAATAITAITAQNSRGVIAIEALSADLVTAQIEAAADNEIGATKIGMLANAAIVEAVAAAIDELELPLVVLDPVLASTTGTRLLDDDGVQTLMLELLPRVLVITPNIPEAEALSGVRIGSDDDVRRAAKQLHAMGAANVVIKGGHTQSTVASRESTVASRQSTVASRQSIVASRQSTVASRQSTVASRQSTVASRQSQVDRAVTDLFYDGRTFTQFEVPRVVGPTVPGTGCSYASALAAFLATNDPLLKAAGKAQQHVAKLIGSYTER